VVQEKVKKYEELNDTEKLQLMSWIVEGLYRSIKGAVANHTYYLMVRDMQGREKFSPENIWKRLGKKQIEHIDHIQPYLKILEEESKKILDSISISGNEENNGS
jgi:hypothetical protein